MRDVPELFQLFIEQHPDQAFITASIKNGRLRPSLWVHWKKERWVKLVRWAVRLTDDVALRGMRWSSIDVDWQNFLKDWNVI